MKKKGSVTIFISLLSSVFLVLFQIMLQSIQIQGGKIQAVTGVEEGLYSVFAQFDRELLQKYHVFFMDGGYGTNTLQSGTIYQTIANHIDISCNSQKTLLDRYGDNLWNIRRETGSITAYMLASDLKGQAFKIQAIDYMKSSVGIQGIQLLLKGAQSGQDTQTEAILQSTSQKVENAKNVYEDAKVQNTETDIGIEQKKNPLDIIRQLQKKGILTLVLPKNVVVSSASINEETRFSNRTCEQGIGLAYTGVGTNTSTDKVLFCEYMLQHLTAYGDELEENGLGYQLEYVICGKETDMENLKSIANRLLAMREAANMMYLTTNATCQTQIHELALTLSTAVGAPALEGIMALALEAAWAFGESLLDVKALFEGEEIPLVKTQESWKLSLEKLTDLPEILEGKSTSTCKGIGYKEYLRMMLLTENMDQQVFRTMDVIEQTMNYIEGKAYFRWDLCVSYIETTFDFSCNNMNFSVTRDYGYEM